MPEESAADAEPQTQPTTGPEAAPEPRPARRRRLPRWLPWAALAIVPALVVGLAVYGLTEGDAGGGPSLETAAIIDGFIQSGQDTDSSVTSYQGLPPEGFPSEFPVFNRARPTVSFRIAGKDGTSYFLIYTVASKPLDVYAFYLQALDREPWQVQAGLSSPDLVGMTFSRPDNAEVEGNVTVRRSEINSQSTIFVSYRDISSSARQSQPDKAFSLQGSRPLPETFPSDIPIFKGRSGESTVTDTYFQRGGGGTNYRIGFLTKDGQDAVVSFYRQEFEKRGWTVTDSPTGNTGFVLSIDFSDGNRGEVQGTVRTDAFDDDPTYTKVDLILQVSSRRGRGN